MRIYLAGLKLEKSTELMVREGIHKLFSYAYPEQLKKYIEFCEKLQPEKRGTLIIDSGAFTMWSKQRGVNIDKYINYVKAQQIICKLWFKEIHPVNLDVIPGEKGKKPTAEQLEQSAIEGWKNFEYMRSKELHPIHIFHAGERFEWLEKLMKESDYIGISPSNDYSHLQKREWLQEVFQYICDKNGDPKVKTHAFGVTSFELLKLFPWFSCDSAAWSLQSGYGGISTPWGKYEVSVRRFESTGLIFKQPQMAQKLLREWLAGFGYKLEDLCTDYKLRDEVNIRYYIWLQDKLVEMNRQYKQKQQYFHFK